MGKRMKELTKRMLEGKKAVLFDLDGTLVDSMGIWKEIDIEYLGRFGIPLPKGLQADIEGMSFSETAVYFKKRFDLPDTVEQIKEAWNRMAWGKYMNEVPLKPGVEAFLPLCRELGIKCGIATSNSRELVENVVKARGVDAFFSCILTACDVGRGKPAPDIYLEAARRLGIAPAGCLVFEDILPGIQSGKAAGMQVCAVDDFYSGDIKEEKRRMADYFINDYWELV